MKKKILSTVLALGMLASAVPAAFAEETPAPVLAEDTAVVEPEFKASYLNVSVKVLEKGELLHTQLLDTEGEEGLYDIAIGDNTLIFDTKGNALTADDIEKDTVIKAFYNANKPMLMIYPPRVTPEVIIVETEAEEGTVPGSVLVETFVKSDYEGQLVSSDNFLRFEPTEDLNVVDAEGNKFEGDLEGRDLVVFYTIATMSIPALTNPEKVVVLDEQEEQEEPAEAVPVTKVSVNGSEAVELDLSAEAEGMLPVRQIAELMGLEVRWDNIVNAVAVGTVQMGVNFNVGVNSYNKARMTPFVLSAAPVQVVEGDYAVTYVPQEFFTELLDAQITTEGDTLVITTAW